MNFPCAVSPYQGSPSRWNTPDLTFAHTIPLVGGIGASTEPDLTGSLALPTLDLRAPDGTVEFAVLSALMPFGGCASARAWPSPNRMPSNVPASFVP